MTIRTLGDITRYHRKERPDKVAMIFTEDNREWTYQALDEEACQCANALRTMGIGNQDRVAYLAKNTPEYFTYLFGIARTQHLPVQGRRLLTLARAAGKARRKSVRPEPRQATGERFSTTWMEFISAHFNSTPVASRSRSVNSCWATTSPKESVAHTKYSPGGIPLN